MYTSKNFKTKKSLKEAIANGEKITVYQAGGFFSGGNTAGGTVTLEGPHYPAPHTWYAQAKLDDKGYIASVK